MNSTMNMEISTPTPPKKEGIGAMFASPTGIIDAEQKTFHPENFLAPNLDVYQLPQQQPSSSQQQQPPNDEFINIPELLNGLPPLLGPLQNDDEMLAEADDDDNSDEPMARVADTFDDKEQLREGSVRVVKFCPWKQAHECSQEFRHKAYEFEKEEAISFKKRHEEELKLQHQQEEEANQRRIHMFTERAHQIQHDEAKDFKNISNIRRQVHDLNDSPRSMLLRKRLFHEAMSE